MSSKWAYFTSTPRYGVFNGGTPIAGWIFYKGKSQSEMDDDWGYPYFRKPPFWRNLPIEALVLFLDT